MKVVLVGSCGYVGSMVYDHLVSAGTNLTCYDIAPDDIYPPHIRKKASELSVEEVSGFDVILYLAGIVRKEDCERRSLDEVIAINVTDLQTLVAKCTTQLCIYASTGALYTHQDGHGHYEKSMQMRETVIQGMLKRTIGLRFGSIIGLSKNMKQEPLHNAMYSSAFTSKEVVVKDPLSRRAILWYRDLMKVVDALIDQCDTVHPGVYNVSSFNTTILETATLIADRTGSKLSSMPGVDTHGFQMDSSMILSALKIEFEGSQETIHALFSSNVDRVVKNPVDKYLKCIICMSPDLESIVNLGSQPLANNFLPTPSECSTYPLHLYRCRVCTHTQLDYLVDRTSLFTNYVYQSGTSATMRAYFAEFAERYTRTSGSTVLELACNDGSQLDEFSKRGWITYGVDPAENIVCNVNPVHKVECTFWGKDDIPSIQGVHFDLIVAQNVFAHVNNPIDFLRQCSAHMSETTLLVIQTSQANMFFNNEFDTIYHEHISFFTIRSMMRAAKTVGCYLENVYKTDVHGSSYVFELKKGDRVSDLPLLEWETSQGLYTDDLYMRYGQNVTNTKTSAIEALDRYKAQGYTLIGYGAAAKGITFLNFLFDSAPHRLCPEYIVDDSPLKIGTYSPGTRTPVKSVSALHTLSGKVLVVILAWNFASEIRQRIRDHMPQGVEYKCLQFFPSLSINDCTFANKRDG
jgi:nucleoside-diphosphate-sugar epimerase